MRFKPDEPRLSSSWCMAKCSGSCDRDKYTCTSAATLNEALPDGTSTGPRRAEVLDSKTGQRFCIAREDEE
ncbi:MAG TPA: hypothetical protein VFX59_03970 [Polyangiales bacterium]|nr:hypothetical protein [Polyangiales bacterium]